jgi:VanZ family protein
MSVRKLAIAFSIFIVVVIIGADLGYLRWVLWLVNRVDNLDKVLHFLLIGTLTYLVTTSLIQTFPKTNINWIVISSIAFFLFVFTLEEISQGPIRGRDFSLEDLAANYLGILIFGFLAWWIYKNKKLAN